MLSRRNATAGDGISFQWQVAVFFAAMAAIFSRLPGAFLHPQFFAEDGWVWYQQAYNLGWLRSLGIAQAGYLQTLPRLVAGLTLLFPMRWAPLIMNLSGAIIQALPVTALLSQRCVTWGPIPLRAFMAVLYIVIPNAPEIHIVLTNAMWHFAVLQALLAFAQPPQSWRGRLVDVLVFGIGTISGPFCILLLPCVAAYWWLRRHRWTMVTLGLLFAGTIAQVFTILNSVRTSGTALGPTPFRLLRMIAGNIFIDSMTGTGGPYLPPYILLAAFVGGLTVVVFGWRSAPLAARLYCVFASLVLIACLRDPLLLPGSMPRWEALANSTTIRYWFLPSLMFLWLATYCAGGGQARWVRVAGLGVLTLTLIGVYRKWVYPTWPPSHWSTDVAHFEKLPRGQHMTFPVYDPGGRSMELIRK